MHDAALIEVAVLDHQIHVEFCLGQTRDVERARMDVEPFRVVVDPVEIIAEFHLPTPLHAGVLLARGYETGEPYPDVTDPRAGDV